MTRGGGDEKSKDERAAETGMPHDEMSCQFAHAKGKGITAPMREVCRSPQGADPPPPHLRVAKAGRNHLNEEITPFLPTGIGKRYRQTISNLGHGALLRRCELPL
jgi:hypothetical protein